MPPEPKSKAPVSRNRRVARRPSEQTKPATPSLSLLPVKEQLQESVLLQKPQKGGSGSEPHRKDDLVADDDWVLEDLAEDEDEWFFEVPLMEEEDWHIVMPVSLQDRGGKSG